VLNPRKLIYAVLITKLPPDPLNLLPRLPVYGPVIYILRSLYSLLAVFIASYDLRSPYEKVHTVLIQWGASLNMEILFGTPNRVRVKHDCLQYKMTAAYKMIEDFSLLKRHSTGGG
jgi:hypothetical protein